MARPRKRYRIFLSSTNEDLVDHRDAVGRAIEGLGQTSERMETFGAAPNTPFGECMRRVDQCDALIVLVAHRYGWVPSKDEGGDGEKSITWHEVERALSKKKPVFAFLVDEKAAWDGPSEQDRLLDVEPEEAPAVARAVRKLRELKAYLSSKVLRTTFTTPESARAEAATSVANWLMERLVAGPAADVAPPLEIGVEDAVQDYVRAARSLHESIQLAGFETRVRVPIRLQDMYVPLHAAVDEREFGEMRAGSGLEAEAELRRSTEVPLTEAFLRAADTGGRRGIVVLGDPGSGKTTHLKRLLLWVVDRGTDEVGLPEGTLPVFLPLRDLRDLESGLDAFLQVQLDRHPHLDAEPGFAKRLLKRGKLLFLLDGLDEVPDVDDRQRVVEWIEGAIEAHGDSRFVVTSRYAGYRALREQFSSRFLELHLRPLTEEQARQFVHNWFRIVETTFATNKTQAASIAAEQADELLARLKEPDFRSARVFEMTRNPLLLTAICLVHRHGGGRLPHRRADLYERCVDVLLESWQSAKRRQVSIDAKSARRVLQPAAYWLHGEEGRTRATAQELEPAIGPALAKVGEGGLAAESFLNTIRDESGLLTGWGDGSYGFLHLGFQEYLAAREIRTRVLEDRARVKELAARFGESWWREVTLLLLALEEPSLFEPLMREVMELPAFVRHEDLVRACLQDSVEVSLAPFWEVANRKPGKSKGLWARQLVALRLLREREPEKVEALSAAFAEHPMREIRELFGAERPAARGTVTAERGGYELVLVPGGSFTMGSTDKEQKRWAKGDETAREWFARESPQHEVAIDAFYLGKYPVTNAEYAEYLKANTDAEEPEYWADGDYNDPKQPVVGVSWEEATAYCQWAGLVLPTEAQWEYACRAGTKTAFWSGDAENDLARAGWYSANFGGRLHPVGEKPANELGLHDMHGNVFEWCRDWYGSYELPVREGDGERVVEGGYIRVRRGGSFARDAQNARSAFRYHDLPGGRWGDLGFRPAKPHP